MMKKQCTTCKEKKVLTCFHKNKRGKHGVQSRCKKCTKNYTSQWYADNKEKVKDKSKDYYLNNSARYKLSHAFYYENNKKEMNTNSVLWKQSNKGKVTAHTADRRAKKRNACVVWRDSYVIQRFYTEAKQLTKDTNIKHHVDHIVPIIHPLVCGLHCEFNLQVITATANLKKSNSFSLF